MTFIEFVEALARIADTLCPMPEGETVNEIIFRKQPFLGKKEKIYLFNKNWKYLLK